MSRDRPRLLLISALLLACLGLEYHFHYVRGISEAYSHLYYVPIVLSTLWWGLRGAVPASLLLGSAHALSHLPTISGAVWLRSLTFVLIGGVMGLISTRRKRAEDQLLDSQKQLRHLAAELGLAEERERRRLASALHDRVGHSLAIAKLKLRTAQALCPGSSPARPLEELREILDDAIRDTRSLTFDLSPPILYELGFESAVEWLAEQLDQDHQIQVTVEDDGQVKPLDEDLRVFLFRAVRELLVNVVKHAKASTAVVRLCRDDQNIEITVQDDGVGFAAEAPGSLRRHVGGFGLFNIREQLDLRRGSLEIQSEPGKGTRVVLTAPLKSAVGTTSPT
jgi:signal transduction histidine kinase